MPNITIGPVSLEAIRRSTAERVNMHLITTPIVARLAIFGAEDHRSAIAAIGANTAVGARGP